MFRWGHSQRSSSKKDKRVTSGNWIRWKHWWFDLRLIKDAETFTLQAINSRNWKSKEYLRQDRIDQTVGTVIIWKEKLMNWQSLNDIIFNILTVNFQCTQNLITQEKIIEVDSDSIKKMDSWIRKEYEEVFLRKLELVLKNPHYYLYKATKEEIWKL